MCYENVRIASVVRLNVEGLSRRENNRCLGWNTDEKYYSKDWHFRRKIKWRFELLGALRIMGEMPL